MPGSAALAAGSGVGMTLGPWLARTSSCDVLQPPAFASVNRHPVQDARVARDRPPLLEGRRMAWMPACFTAGGLIVLVLSERLLPWVAALVHVVVLSLIAYVLFAWDKRRARRDGRRISEANLLWIALLGGAAGAWIGMRRKRHKTQHSAFRFLVPFALLVHAAAIAWLAARA